MPRMHDPLDDLLDAPGAHAISLLEGKGMICRLELHEGTCRPGADVHDCLQQLGIGVPGGRRAEPTEERCPAAAIHTVDHTDLARVVVAAQRAPHSIIQWLVIS